MSSNNKNTLQQAKKNIKLWWEAHQSDLFWVALVVLLSVIFLGAGRLWFATSYEPAGRTGGVEPHKIFIEENAFPVPPPSVAIKNFVASMNGKKYYPAGCKAAHSINKENIVWFTSKEEAREMGYTPSAQC